MDEKRKRASIIKTVALAMKLMFQNAKKRDIIFSYMWLLTAVSASVVLIFEREFLNSAALIVSGESDTLVIVFRWLALWTGFMLFNGIMGLISNKSSTRMWSDISINIKGQLLHKIAKIKYHYFDHKETYKKLEFVKNDMSWRVQNVLSAAFDTVFVCIQLVTVSIIILNENPLIALVIIIGIIPTIILSHMQTESEYWGQMYNSQEVLYQTYISWVLFKRPYMKEMRFGNLYDHMNEKFDKSSMVVHDFRVNMVKKFAAFRSAALVFSWAAVAVSLMLVANDIVRGVLYIGSFLLVYRAVQRMQGGLTNLFGKLITIGNEGRFIEDYFEVMNYEEEKIELIAEAPQNIDIDVKDLSFTYPNTDREILKGISVSIKQGEKIAIVGENGSGKSTFISLLCGLYPPSGGEILINGVDISENLSLLRSKMSCTFQHFGFYEVSVRENVALGDLGKIYTDEAINTALEQSGAQDFVEEFEGGLDTYLGNHKIGATNISGGQWQKIAMARNFLKKDARLVILDEPTAALDPVSEARLYEEFNTLMGDKTVILISHRLGSTRLADRILVFHEGEIIEQGTHDELMGKNGMYTAMYNSQSQWYV